MDMKQGTISAEMEKIVLKIHNMENNLEKSDFRENTGFLEYT